MKNKTLLFYAALFAVGVAIQYEYATLVERMTKNAMEAEYTHKLDLFAIERARGICVARVQAGEYRTYQQANEDLQNEIKLQTIAVHEM